MKSVIPFEPLPSHPHRSNRSIASAVSQITLSRAPPIPHSSNGDRRTLNRRRGISQSHELPLTATNAGPKTVDNVMKVVCSKARPPLREFIGFNQFQDLEINVKKGKPLFPLITQRASLKHNSRLPPIAKPPLQNILDLLPKTGQYLPFTYPLRFMPITLTTREEIGENTPVTLIRELQQSETERLVCAGTRPDIHGKLIYDMYENSPYQENYGYEEFLKYGLDPCFVDCSPAFYSSICAGKGAPSKFVPNKSRYYESLVPYYKLENEKDETLVFESRFECANLRRAIKVSENEYDLFMKTDYSTAGFAQWFFFKVTNTRKGKSYKFNIINMLKPNSLYNQGMKILVYSTRNAEEHKVSWQRQGSNIAYYKNCIRRHRTHYYTLSFSITSEYDNDELYIASDYPYGYTDLLKLLSTVCTEKNGKRVRKATLCKTLAGNPLPMLIITNFETPESEIRERPAVILTGRVHPGEANSSYIMEGIIKYLLGDTIEANRLRNFYVFKIVPMLNPDGVIIGNYRCSLSGHDLNRQWVDPKQHVFPEIYHTKKMIKQTLENRKIAFFCDFHGHSRKKDIFIYGCNASNASDKLKERVFPWILGQKHPAFSYADCCFTIQKPREGTARVTICKELEVVNSYTCEASFCGNNRDNLHFTPNTYYEFGAKFCETLLDILVEWKVEETVKVLTKMHASSITCGNEQAEDGSDSADDDDDGSAIRKIRCRKHKRRRIKAEDPPKDGLITLEKPNELEEKMKGIITKKPLPTNTRKKSRKYSNVGNNSNEDMFI